MKKLAFLVISMFVFLSCNKNQLFDIEDVTIIVGDSVNAKIKKLYVVIESSLNNIIEQGGFYNLSGISNIDVNYDGEFDFGLYSNTTFSPDSKGSGYYWSLKSLSENIKVLCDTIIETYDFNTDYYFFAPGNLSIKDKLSATDQLWLNSPPERRNDEPFGSSYDSSYPCGGFLLFRDYYGPLILPPGLAKGNVKYIDWISKNEKYVGFLIENNGIITIGWMKFSSNYQEKYSQKIILVEIGTANFPINGQ